jgi:tetratricopeptide (TPR) repeat protein
LRKCILFLLLFAAVSVSARNANQIQLDSLLSANAGAKEDTNKVKLLRAISMAYGDGDPRNERLYGEAVIALSQKLGWSKGISLGLTAVAFSYQAQADFPKALDFLFKALAIDEKEGDGKMIAGNLDNIGTIYSICGDFPKALCYYTQSLQKNEQLHNRRGVATTLGNMAGVYGDQHDYLKALDYYTRSADICEAEGMREGVLRAHVNIAAIYQEQGNFVQSLNINFEGLREAQGQGDKVIMCAIYGNIGSCYLSIAKDSVHRSLQNESIPSRRAAVGLATKYLMQSVELCSEIQNLDVLEESYHQLSEVQELDGKSRAALQSFKNYIAIKDSIH